MEEGTKFYFTAFCLEVDHDSSGFEDLESRLKESGLYAVRFYEERTEKLCKGFGCVFESKKNVKKKLATAGFKRFFVKSHRLPVSLSPLVEVIHGRMLLCFSKKGAVLLTFCFKNGVCKYQIFGMLFVESDESDFSFGFGGSPVFFSVKELGVPNHTFSPPMISRFQYSGKREVMPESLVKGILQGGRKQDVNEFYQGRESSSGRHVDVYVIRIGHPLHSIEKSFAVQDAAGENLRVESVFGVSLDWKRSFDMSDYQEISFESSHAIVIVEVSLELLWNPSYVSFFRQHVRGTPKEDMNQISSVYEFLRGLMEKSKGQKRIVWTYNGAVLSGEDKWDAPIYLKTIIQDSGGDRDYVYDLNSEDDWVKVRQVFRQTQD